MPNSGSSALSSETAAASERDWDQFLEVSPRGQYQQSSRWARAKALDGWQVHRVFANGATAHEGGFQLLWRASRFGRVGYVSKGPVLPAEDDVAVARVLGLLRASVRSLGLQAVIVQPPDASSIDAEALARSGSSPRRVTSISRAEFGVDLRGGARQIESQFHKKVRQHARKASREGVEVRAGTRADLPVFFELMAATCRRQGVAPNPSRCEVLEALWDEFSPHARVSFAYVDGVPAAGLFMIGFDDRAVFWRKGWDAQRSTGNANALLCVSDVLWPGEHGYSSADFGVFDEEIAERTIAGEALTEAQQHSLFAFTLSLGGEAHLVPPAMLIIRNPLARFAFDVVGRVPRLQQAAFRRAGLG